MSLMDLTLAPSSWIYDTSNEASYSLNLATIGSGRFFLKNEANKDEKLTISYFYATLGYAKGGSINYAASLTSDPSYRIGHIAVRRDCTFGPGSFPCYGYIVFGALTAGLLQPSFLSHSGGEIALAVLGPVPELPFAVIAFRGLFNSILPSGGVSLGPCRYDVG
jgi:hypothetical protein